MRKIKRAALLMILASCVVSAYAQGTDPALHAGRTDGLKWTEMAAMFGLFSGVVGAIQWIVCRALVGPMMQQQTDAIKGWATKTFPSTEKFDAHAKSDDDHQERTEKDLDWIWKRLLAVPKKDDA